MSMWLSLARVSPAALGRIEQDPSLIDALFFDDDEDAKKVLADLGVEEGHAAGFDYRSAHESLVAMAEATGEELAEDKDPVLDDLGVTGELEYDAGYGPAFTLDPAATKRAAESMAAHIDAEVKAVILGAGAAGDCLVGVIS